MRKKYNVAVVGATGAVGSEMIKILEQRNFPVDRIKLLASERSAGMRLKFKEREEYVYPLAREGFEDIDIGLFSPGASVSEIYAPIAAKRGCVVVDNTSRFRMEQDVPLVVPEVNPDAVEGYKKRNIISNPNCSTIQLVVALKPIYDRVGIKRVIISTYQAVSGAGKEAMDELSDQVRAIFSMKKPKRRVFPAQIAFNCIPQIDEFLDNGYTKEEMKLINETKKIIGDKTIAITATAVRVPVFIGHSESVSIETEDKISVKEVKRLLKDAPGVRLSDDPSSGIYPMPIHSSGRDEVFVGRIRCDNSIANGINMWIVSDNLRKGAALNAVQIAEILVKEYI